MLNRRSLRVKVAQSMYAYNQRKMADYEMSVDFLKDRFSPNSYDLKNLSKEALDGLKEEALSIFKKEFPNHRAVEINTDKAHIKEAVKEAFRLYEVNLNKDLQQLKKDLVKEAEDVFNKYLLILNLLISFSTLSSGYGFKKSGKVENKNLQNNKVIKALRSHESLERQIRKAKATWEGQKELVALWYKDVVCKSVDVNVYKQLIDPGLEDDLKILTLIVKNLIFKNDVINNYFEDLDFNWEENKNAVKSLVLKTLKSVVAVEDGYQVEMGTLSYNWDDDKAFFIDLFNGCIEKDEEFDALVAGKSKNWDIHRLAVMDKIILKIAICEMIIFPSIPVKVTINEYIEISKRYSTPKSKQFVNGLLDGLATKLLAEGIVKKSGRGLIDNK